MAFQPFDMRFEEVHFAFDSCDLFVIRRWRAAFAFEEDVREVWLGRLGFRLGRLGLRRGCLGFWRGRLDAWRDKRAAGLPRMRARKGQLGRREKCGENRRGYE